MQKEAELRKHRCCFTGHRPEKLEKGEIEVKQDLERAILRAFQDGFNVFITGMAPGVDIWAAEVVLDLRRKGMPIRLICASPFEGFERRWSILWQWRYSKIIKEADLVRYISNEYSPNCFQKRNEWMVDHSSLVIAIYNGYPGGTRNTINYSKKRGIPVIII